MKGVVGGRGYGVFGGRDEGVFGGRGEGCVCGVEGGVMVCLVGGMKVCLEGGVRGVCVLWNGYGWRGGVDALREKTLLEVCVTQVSLITSETHSFQ